MPTLFLSILAGLAGLYALRHLWDIECLRRWLRTGHGRRRIARSYALRPMIVQSRLPWIAVLTFVAAWFVALGMTP